MADTERQLVIGCGSESAGDDAVGLELVRQAAKDNIRCERAYRLLPPTPIDLLDSFDDADCILFVDVVAAPEPAGTIHLVKLPSNTIQMRNLERSPAHGYGLAEVLDLARALGRRVPRLALLGISAEDFTPGGAISDPAERAIDYCLEHLDELCELAGSDCQSTTICFSAVRELAHA